MEHLDSEDGDLLDPSAAFARSAARLQSWHDGGRRGTRPPGRLRPLPEVPVSRLTGAWATPMYRTVYDPDGRPLRMRLRRRF